MIKANELRIGNYLNFIYKSDEHEFRKPKKINATHIRNIEAAEESEEFKVEDFFEPIELTPEILEAAGFVFYDNLYSNGNLEFPATLKKDGSEMYLVPNSIYCLELKYLHQLQNLYYSLTGEELTIKEIAPTQ